MKPNVTVTRSLIALALLLAALLVATAAGQAARQGAPGPFPFGPPPTIDQDGNGLFDDLEARMAELQDNSKVDVLVELNSSATASRVSELSERIGGFSTSRRFGIVDGFAATVTKAQARLLARLPSVAHVELDGEVHALNDSAQASFGVTKARIDDPALDGDGDGNPNVYSPADLVAAVIDTGIDAKHLDLDGGKVIAWKDYVNNQPTPYDDNGHGTHVSGTIAGDGDGRADHLYHGVAPAAGLIGLKVLNSAGSGSFANVISALDWTVTNKATYGIEAVNLSLGADGCNNGTDLTSQAIGRAVAAGIVVVVAAGNAGPGTCTVGTPGAAPAALTVGAMTDLGPGGFYLASFSSRGLDRRRPHQARRRRSRRVGDVVRGQHDQRLLDLQRHEHGDAVRRRRLAADARREPLAHARSRSRTRSPRPPRTGAPRVPTATTAQAGSTRTQRCARQARRSARPAPRCRRTRSAAARCRPAVRAPTSRSTSPTRSTRSRRR